MIREIIKDDVRRHPVFYTVCIVVIVIASVIIVVTPYVPGVG